MDQSTSAESRQITILSNAVLSPQENTSHNGDVIKSEIIDITHNEIKHEPHRSSARSSDRCGGSRLFNNLFFELPTKQGLAEKRKQLSSVGEGSPRKKGKTGDEVTVDSEDCDGDEEDKVFNYLTGTYENVRKSVESKVHEDLSVEVLSHQDDVSSNTDMNLDAPEVDSLLERNDASDDDDRSNNAIVSLDASNENLVLESPSTSNNENISLNTRKENYMSSDAIPMDSISKPSGNIQNKDLTDTSLRSKSPVSTELKSAQVEKCIAKKMSSLKLNTLNWNCKTCGHNARTKQELISHVYNAHLKEDYEIKIKCKICNFQCDTQSEMEKHELSHEENTTSSASSAVSISQSSAPIVRLPLHDIIPNSSDESLERNSQTRGTEISQNSRDVLETSDSDDALPSDTKGKRVQCCLCNYKTNKVSKLKRHAERHSGLKYYCEDHFWIGAMTTCPKCIFEKLMLNRLIAHAGSLNCQRNVLKAMDKKQLAAKRSKIENKNNSVENQSSGCSAQPVQHSVLTVESSQNKQIPLKSVSDVAQNVASLENTDQNKSGAIENQSSQCSVQPAQHSVLTVESSQNKQISLQIASEVAHNAISLENADQNKRGGLENQSSQCSVQLVHNSVINGEPSPNIETSLTNVWSIVHNVPASVQKDNVSNVNASKKRKNSDTSDTESQIIDLDESDSSAEIDFPVSFKCFDCDKAIFKKDELRTHALSCHPDSSFICDQHESKTRFYECQKCVYELIFKNGQVTRSGRDEASDEDSSQGVRMGCDDDLDSMQIRTGVDAFDEEPRQLPILRAGTSKGKRTSKCKEPKFSKKWDTDTDSDSDTSVDADATDVRVTRARASKNPSLMKQSGSKLTSTVVDENSNGTASTDYLSSTEIENAEPPTNSEIRIAGKCFDCEYTNVRDLCNLKKHACRHLGSKYQCVEHWKVKLKDCLKCAYEVVLKNLHNEVKICSTCGYKTSNKYMMDRHRSGREACDKWQKRKLRPEELMCFECEYITTYKDLLKYHMVDHLDREFSCKEHPDNKEEECLKCVHQECLENARKEALSCEECGFKTVRKEVFKIHRCRVQSDDEFMNEVVSEGLCIITQESVEVAIDTTAKKYSCFDCDEFDTDTMDDLKKHANLHCPSNFQCNEHSSDTVEECSKCIYQKVVKSLKNSTGKSTDVSSNKILTSSDISLVDSENTKRSSENDRKNAPNSDDLLPNERSPQNNTGDIGNQQSEPSQAKCFDCKYSGEKGYTFRRHVSRHFGSKYQCLKHWQNKVTNCSKCHYEEVLQNLYKTMKVCKACGYKTLERCNFTRHLSRGKSCKQFLSRRRLLPSEVICFGCQYITTNETLLRYHMVDHLGREFSCKKHRAKKKGSCERCINEKCLERAKKEALTCKKCSFKTIVKKVFELHECIPSSAAKSKCILTDKNVDEELDNAKNTLERSNIFSTEAGKAATIHIGHSTDNKKISDNQTAITAKCFDCKSFNSCKDWDFMKHVCRHIGSKYQCMEHWKDKLENRCLKCYYERALKNLKKQVQFCQTCRYRTIEKTKMDRHCASKDSCQRRLNRKVLPGEIRCLECYYVTTRKKFLTYHMVDHLDRKFSCDVHRENKIKECEKCINEECLESAKKEAKICEKCKFKTVIQEIFERHECTAKSGSGSTEGTSKEVWVPEGQDSEVITIEDVEVGIEATAKTYRCFDCKEFATDTMDGLRKHANLHSRSEFQCDEHCAGPAAEDCAKCIYQKLLNNSETHNYGYSLQTIGLSLAESENDASNSENNNKTTENQQEAQDGSKNNEDKKTAVKAKCFDCKGSSAGKDCDFKTHVCRHIGSKYQCMEHWKNKVKHCSKCNYEEILKNLRKEVKSCKTCGCKAFDQISLTRHIEGLDTCKEWAGRILGPEEIRCLGCHYVTARKEFLKYHMVDHLDLKFSCDMHRENKNEKCEKCINEECLETAKKEAKICEKCKFKTVIKQIFKIHDCEGKMSVTFVNGSTEGTSEAICTPEDQDIDVITIEEDVEVGIEATAKKYSCFDCKEFATDTMDGLRKHANLHSQSKFQCDEHSSDPAAEDCAKCIYQKLVNKSGIRNKNSVDDEADGPVAENYRHARKNNNSNSRNNNNTIENEQESRGSKNNDDKKTEIKAKCFDCKNSSAGKDCDFKTHVSRHIGSKYQCMEHLKNKIKQCSKCHYEEVLKNLPKEVKSCKTCGYKAFDQISLTRHIEGLDTCKDWAGRILGPGEIRCLGCYYVTARKEFLKYHMVDHLDLKFSCDMHREIKNEKCEKCINEECLESAKKEAKICEKCKFKSVIKQIFKIHDCEGKMSVTFVNGSTERTSEAICTPEAQDSDVITIEDSVEVGSDTTAKKYSCFDCKEFATGTMDDLRKHAKFHSQSKFHCDEHCTGPAAEDCSKCIYQELVNKSEIQNKSNVGSEADVPVAENYRHSLKNNDSNSRSNKTTGNEQESQDGGENNDGKNTEVKDKCFDCKYYFAGKDCDFKKHVSRHIGSKYQCMDHWKNNVKHCSKCHYEEVLKNVSKEVKSCKTCGYKAFDQVSLTRHIEGKTCKKWAGRLLGAGEIRCLVCRYVTARKTFLKYHMVDHLDLKFSCDMHPENNHERCEKCINEECLESAKKEAKICEKCKFKTVIKQIFEMHECKAKIAATSTGSTKQDITNPEEQNSDVIIIEKRFEEGTDKIAGKLRCFDCNEFTTDTANELKNHAIRHYKTTFHCAEHCSNSAAGDCSKCIYQNVIKSMENRVFVCDKCQFKTDSEDAFSNHDCDVANDKDSDITSSKKGEYNAVPASGSSELLEPTLNVFKCFDCGVTKHTILCLKNHAEVHLGSTFRCETHYAQPYINCQKCVYEDIIKNIGNNTFTCKSCGFKAYSCLYLRNHEQSKVNCELYKEKLLSQGESLEVVQVKTFRCFDCGFSHERRDFLENHILVHARSTFQCENHNEYLEGCQQCLYRSLLDQGRNRFLRKCFHCNPPKTFCSPSSIKKHIMRIHQGSFYSCKRHNQRTEHCSRCAFEYLVMAANQNVFRIVCCDCKDERFASKATLKDHIKKFHLRSSFGCNIHPLSRKPDVCHMCLYEDLVQLCESEANSVEIVASRSKRGLSHYQCFDCDFKSRGRVAIATHIRKKHLESNFSCREHTLGDIDESTCSMCRYEHVLVTTKQDVVFRCSICNFEALNTNALSKHHKQKHAEVTSMNIARVRDASPKHPKEKHIKASSKNKARVSNVLRKKLTRYTCFDCVYFVTNSRKNLFRHVSRATHKSRTFKFTCRKHKLFDDACERCAFAKISDRVKRRKKSLKKP